MTNFIGIFMGHYTSRIIACSWENNTQMDPQEVGWEGMAGLICFRIGTSGGLL